MWDLLCVIHAHEWLVRVLPGTVPAVQLSGRLVYCQGSDYDQNHNYHQANGWHHKTSRQHWFLLLLRQRLCQSLQHVLATLNGLGWQLLQEPGRLHALQPNRRLLPVSSATRGASPSSCDGKNDKHHSCTGSSWLDHRDLDNGLLGLLQAELLLAQQGQRHLAHFSL